VTAQAAWRIGRRLERERGPSSTTTTTGGSTCSWPITCSGRRRLISRLATASSAWGAPMASRAISRRLPVSLPPMRATGASGTSRPRRAFRYETLPPACRREIPRRGRGGPDDDGWMDLILANDTVPNSCSTTSATGPSRKSAPRAGSRSTATGRRGGDGIEHAGYRDDGAFGDSDHNFANEMRRSMWRSRCRCCSPTRPHRGDRSRQPAGAQVRRVLL